MISYLKAYIVEVVVDREQLGQSCTFDALVEATGLSHLAVSNVLMSARKDKMLRLAGQSGEWIPTARGWAAAREMRGAA